MAPEEEEPVDAIVVEEEEQFDDDEDAIVIVKDSAKVDANSAKMKRTMEEELANDPKRQKQVNTGTQDSVDTGAQDTEVRSFMYTCLFELFILCFNEYAAFVA